MDTQEKNTKDAQQEENVPDMTNRHSLDDILSGKAQIKAKSEPKQEGKKDDGSSKAKKDAKEGEQKPDEAAKEDKGKAEEPSFKDSPEYKKLSADIATLEKRLKDTRNYATSTESKNKALLKELKALKDQYDGKEPSEEDKAAEEWERRLQLSEELAIETHPDYYEVVGENGVEDSPYMLALKEDKALVEHRVLNAKNPALMAYKIGKEYLAKQKLGSTPEEIKQNVRKELLEDPEFIKSVLEKAGIQPKKGLKPTNDELPSTLRDVEGKSDENDMATSYKRTPLDQIFSPRGVVVAK